MERVMQRFDEHCRGKGCHNEEPEGDNVVAALDAQAPTRLKERSGGNATQGQRDKATASVEQRRTCDHRRKQEQKQVAVEVGRNTLRYEEGNSYKTGSAQVTRPGRPFPCP